MADILDRFRSSDTDDDDEPKYYGFLARNSEWYILKETTVAPKQNRYARGQGDYPSAWAGRGTLSYGYFDEVF